MQNRSPDVNPAADRSPEAYASTPVVREEHAEDQVTRIIEQQAAKLPSDIFLFTALAAMAASALFEISGNTRASRFIGMWPPAILTMGMYNKMVKMMGTR
jgi:hypothetical protein